MRIEVSKENRKYVARLYIEDGTQFAISNPENRPGCSVRTVINAVARVWGEPEGFSIEVEGW